MATYTDTFTGSNGTALATYSANWTFITADSGDASLFGITNSGTAAGALFSATALTIFRSVHGSYANDQYSEVVIENINALSSNATTYELAVMVRVSADTGAGADCYALGIVDDASNGGTHSFALLSVLNNTVTVLGSAFTSTLSNGDTIRLEVSGTTLTAKKNGSTIGTPQTDANLASGNAGIGGGRHSGSIRATSWAGGDLGGAFTPNKRKLLLGAG